MRVRAAVGIEARGLDAKGFDAVASARERRETNGMLNLRMQGTIGVRSS
jgi:hypothetical protein